MGTETDLAEMGALVLARLRARVATVLGEGEANLDGLARRDVLAGSGLRVPAVLATAWRSARSPPPGGAPWVVVVSFAFP